MTFFTARLRQHWDRRERGGRRRNRSEVHGNRCGRPAHRRSIDTTSRRRSDMQRERVRHPGAAAATTRASEPNRKMSSSSDRLCSTPPPPLDREPFIQRVDWMARKLEKQRNRQLQSRSERKQGARRKLNFDDQPALPTEPFAKIQATSNASE